MSSEPVKQAREHGWVDEAASFGRAFAGAYLFGIPLLFTMEMWWIGTYADLWKLILFLALTFLANVVLTYLAGFKPRRETSLIASIDESVDTLAVGVVASLIVLLVLNRIAPGDPLDAILGMVIVQTIPLSIGASLANAVFDRREGRTGEQPSAAESHAWRDALNDLGATIIGGGFIGFSIAPTDEIQLLAASVDIYHEVALVVLTLVVGYIIVFTSGFDPESAGPRPTGPFQHPITETVVSYVVSLSVAFWALYLLDRVDFGDPFPSVLSQVLVLGLPTMVGGAAGRLAV